MIIIYLVLGLLIITGGIVTIFHIKNAPVAYENEEAFYLGALPPGTEKMHSARVGTVGLVHSADGKPETAPKLVKRFARAKPAGNAGLFQAMVTLGRVGAGDAKVSSFVNKAV
jgi:hypothetical protein